MDVCRQDLKKKRFNLEGREIFHQLVHVASAARLGQVCHIDGRGSNTWIIFPSRISKGTRSKAEKPRFWPSNIEYWHHKVQLFKKTDSEQEQYSKQNKQIVVKSSRRSVFDMFSVVELKAREIGEVRETM